MDRRLPTPTRERIDACLQRARLAGPNVRVVPLTGDASTRQYFRILRPDNPSVVLAVYESAFTFDDLPFVNVSRLMSEVPLPIPAIAGHDDDLGILILEDLGDVTLQAHLGVSPPDQHYALYDQAVEFIARLQRRGRELESAEYLPFGISFDREKLTWELDFFVKHFLGAYRGVELPAAAQAGLAEEWARIAGELADQPPVLCHRDYHSRNLMLHQSRLYIIDFQDARMGPDTYDLVSLLRDSYVDLSEETVDALIARFLTLCGGGSSVNRAGPHPRDGAPMEVERSSFNRAGPHPRDGAPMEVERSLAAETKEFRQRFDLMALQRNLKALGTFGYQTTARKNPVYIQYIPRTLRHVRTNLERHPRFGRLRDLLSPLVEELR